MRFPPLILLCVTATSPVVAFVPPPRECRKAGQILRSQIHKEVLPPRTTTALDALETDASSSTDGSTKNLSNTQEVIPKSPRNVWRKRWHNWLRDSGGVRLFMDTATRLIAAPQLYQEHPHCFPEFVRISGSEYSWLLKAMRSLQIMPEDQPDVHFSRESYGEHPLQVAQVMVNSNATIDIDDILSQQQPLFFFVHGGAWGSGFPTMYRFMSVPFLQRGFRAVILGYRTYPDSKIEDQVDDISNAIEYFQDMYAIGIGGDKPPVILMGHSSGAHVSLLAALKGKLSSVDAIIAASGVYDCLAQAEPERGLDIDQLSPLSPAAGTLKEQIQSNSPSWIVLQAKEAEIKAIPPVLLVHGNDDTVVLPSSSEIFHKQLKERSLSTRVDLKILDGTGHQDPVVQSLVGGKTQSVIFEWLEEVFKTH